MVISDQKNRLQKLGMSSSDGESIHIDWSKIPFSEPDRPYWAALSSIDGIGPATLPVLIVGFGSARAVLEAPGDDLIAAGVSQKIAARIAGFQKGTATDLWFNRMLHPAGDIELSFLAPADSVFPNALRTVEYGPSQLWVWGDAKLLQHHRIIAVVGTRKVTPYGVSVTMTLSRDLARAGCTIVSGLMYGVDEVAMRAAMSAGGTPIGVWAGGLTSRSLGSRYRLAEDSVNHRGVVISEFSPTLLPSKGTFPARNRIVAGLSRAVVVTEGASDSGSLITARNAVEQGKPIGAIPGPITSALSAGTNELLKLGATPVTSADDIFDMIGGSAGEISQRPAYQPKNQIEQRILTILSEQILDTDELSRKIGIPIDTFSAVLTELELGGVIRQIGDAWEQNQ